MKKKNQMKITYKIFKSFGDCASESYFKKKYKNLFKNEKDIFFIENLMEQGMPDIIEVYQGKYIRFIEVKYAKSGWIKFQPSQIVWFNEHKHLPVYVLAFNDLTQNIHYMDVNYVLQNVKNLRLKLQEEKELEDLNEDSL